MCLPSRYIKDAAVHLSTFAQKNYPPFTFTGLCCLCPQKRAGTDRSFSISRASPPQARRWARARLPNLKEISNANRLSVDRNGRHKSQNSAAKVQYCATAAQI